MLDERRCLQEAIELEQKLRASVGESGSVESKINSALQIIHSKGIYPLYCWLQTKLETKDGKMYKTLLDYVHTFCKEHLFKNPTIRKNETMHYVFENCQGDLSVELLIRTKKDLEKILNFVLYKVRAEEKNRKGGSPDAKG